MKFLHIANRVKQINGSNYIFDPIRKKYVRMQPEEWVRQHIIHHLVHNLGYPLGLITLEKLINYDQISKRADIIVRNKDGFSPLLLIECKASYVYIKQQHLDQLAIYNATVQAPFIVLTNGIQEICFKKNTSSPQYTQLPKLPSFHETP